MVLTIQGQSATWTLTAQNLSSNFQAAHIHGPAAVGANAGILVNLSLTPAGTAVNLSGSFGPADVSGMSWDTFLTNVRNGMTYVNVHTVTNGTGEIRGQL